MRGANVMRRLTAEDYAVDAVTAAKMLVAHERDVILGVRRSGRHVDEILDVSHASDGVKAFGTPKLGY